VEGEGKRRGKNPLKLFPFFKKMVLFLGNFYKMVLKMRFLVKMASKA
jgi:hypothetical protein